MKYEAEVDWANTIQCEVVSRIDKIMKTLLSKLSTERVESYQFNTIY